MAEDMAFCYSYNIKAHGTTELKVMYTNRADCVENCIGWFQEWLKNENQKIVGLDVEYTWPRGLKQRAAVIRLCVGEHVLVYQISKADMPCGMLEWFMSNNDYTFAGVDIGNDIKMLGRVYQQVGNFVDIQTRWRVPTSNIDKTKDGLTDYAASIIDSSYSSMKRDFILGG
jgi:uncharacterized protein YlxP (DUF503 family)